MENAVTLVIDDGPSDATEALVTLLASAGHRAVLFIVGHQLAGLEAIASGKAAHRMRTLIHAVQCGFALGNHSWAHPRFSTLNLKQASESLVRTERLIDDIYADAGVQRPGKWFRFPYSDAGGNQHRELQSLLRHLGFEAHPGPGDRLDWPATLSTRDWELPSEPTFRQRLRHARPGEIIEFHDFARTVARYGHCLVEELSALSLRANIPCARPCARERLLTASA